VYVKCKRQKEDAAKLGDTTVRRGLRWTVTWTPRNCSKLAKTHHREIMIENLS